MLDKLYLKDSTDPTKERYLYLNRDNIVTVQDCLFGKGAVINFTGGQAITIDNMSATELVNKLSLLSLYDSE